MARRDERARSRKTLKPEDWIRATLETLVKEGPASIQITRIARELGVTPPSFYWHFKSREQLRDRVLEWWMRMLRGAASEAERRDGATGGFGALSGVLAERELPRTDQAMRRWAEEDPVVAAAVGRADELRIRAVTQMLEHDGLEPKQANDRARMLLWTWRGSLGEGEELRGRTLTQLFALIARGEGSPPS